MVILQSHRTQNMILTEMLSPCICYTSETCQILSPVLYQPPFNSQNLVFTCLCSFFTCFAVLEDGALLRQNNGYIVWSRGARARRAQAPAQNIAAA